MRWTDVIQIAEELHDKFPDVDPKTVRFVDLHNWVCTLDGFDDDPQRGGERVLEAIQAAWIQEGEDDDA
ncbi:MAG: iscX [Paucimonas sp.]|nr:iscX [Paucimonas sp.]